MKNKNLDFYSKNYLELLCRAQESIKPSYNVHSYLGENARVIENQSADFFNSYANGEIEIEAGAEDVLEKYIRVAKETRYHYLKKSISRAEKIFSEHKTEDISNVQSSQESQNKSISPEILDNKKEARKLNSASLLMIYEQLSTANDRTQKKYFSKLSALAQSKISDVQKHLSEKDDKFDELLNLLGTYDQKKYFRDSHYHPVNLSKNQDSPVKKDQKTSLWKYLKNRISSKSKHNASRIQFSHRSSSKNNKHSFRFWAKSAFKKINFFNYRKDTYVRPHLYDVMPHLNPNKEQTEVKKTNFISRTFSKMSFRVKSVCRSISDFVQDNKIYCSLCAVAIGLWGYLGYKNAFPLDNNANFSNKTEMKAKIINITKDSKTADFSKTQQELLSQKNINNKKEISHKEKALQKAYKNRFDTSLEILLGTEKRDKLYHTIDQLAQQNKIKFSDGTTREWYAHAFTMYHKIAPNSVEYAQIKKLLHNEKVNSDYINSLVIKAKRNGTGVKGTSSYSDYDHASETLQNQHKQSNNAVRMALNNLQRS